MIETYQSKVSNRLASNCHFEPSCSEYGRQAFLTYHTLKATSKTLGRIIRCSRATEAGIPDPLLSD
jgi:putative membrane protein insertion efficiency factor